MTQNIEICKVSSSRIKNVDFDNLMFGSVFSDHMFTCDYSHNSWHSPKIVPYGPLSMTPSIRALHYGQAIFEGMKAYKDAHGKSWLFRPEDNAKRISISAKRLSMPEFSTSLFMKGLKLLMNIDEQWIPKKENASLYIRPLMFASEANIKASTSKEYKFVIFSCPVGPYYSGEVSVKIADHYSRATNGGVGFAKAAGNYAAQFYPTELAIEEGYQQIIWTDAHYHDYLEESGTMNIFFRINDKLVTTPINDRILDGITRKSIITLAKDQGIEVEERAVRVKELISALENGSLKEIFGSGTAVVITSIHKFGYKENRYTLPKLEDSYAQLFKQQIVDLQYNRSKDKFGWLVGV